MPPIFAQVKCGCGIVLQQKICQNGSNAGRPFLACPKMRDVCQNGSNAGRPFLACPKMCDE
eukprot:710926-Pelagomonas_calceolata.AAC.1